MVVSRSTIVFPSNHSTCGVIMLDLLFGAVWSDSLADGRGAFRLIAPFKATLFGSIRGAPLKPLNDSKQSQDWLSLEWETISKLAGISRQGWENRSMESLAYQSERARLSSMDQGSELV